MKVKIAGIFVVLLVLTACQSNKMDIKSIPDFVMNPPVADDFIYGVGYGKKSSPNLSMKQAEINARADIANQIETSIQASITDYAQEAGVENESQTIEFIESVTRQITDTTLSGATIVQREALEDGGWWVLMSYDKNALLNTFNDFSSSFEESEAAAFANFKAEEALNRLQKELEDNPTTSSPVE